WYGRWAPYSCTRRRMDRARRSRRGEVGGGVAVDGSRVDVLAAQGSIGELAAIQREPGASGAEGDRRVAVAPARAFGRAVARQAVVRAARVRRGHGGLALVVRGGRTHFLLPLGAGARGRGALGERPARRRLRRAAGGGGDERGRHGNGEAEREERAERQS